jgi:DNA-binding NtrC family response regulator
MNDCFRVLVVEDEPITRKVLHDQVAGLGFACEVAENGFVALAALKTATWDVVLTDLRMPGMDGIELLRKTKAMFPETEVILVTGQGGVKEAVAAMQEGAADFLRKPVQTEELKVRLTKAAATRAIRRELANLRSCLDVSGSGIGLAGDSPAMHTIHQRIKTFAASSVPVLVTGRTGTGKEVVSRALHVQGPRSHGPFVAIACGAVPQSLAESELFGHEKGAFTGAIQLRRGSFERANGGTILLDDVDDLPLEIQVKLLRVLQEGTLQRVGGEKEITVDVRVIATTKEDLAKAVAEGRFREDLFYRLRGLELVLPPLKDRGSDVLLLAQFFLGSIASRDRTAPKRLSPETAKLLRQYDWPGNIRELRQVMETASVLCPELEISPEHLPDFVQRRSASMSQESDVLSLNLDLEACGSIQFRKMVEQFEKKLIDWALTRSGGNQSQAAELLQLPRTTFQSKLPLPR